MMTATDSSRFEALETTRETIGGGSTAQDTHVDWKKLIKNDNKPKKRNKIILLREYENTTY